MTAALALAVAAALALAVAGFDGDEGPSKPPGALAAALSYLPEESGFALAMPTRPVARRLNLPPRAVFAEAGLDLGGGLGRSQLGGPAALGVAKSGGPIAAIRVRDAGALRARVENRIDAGSARRLGDHRGAIVWRERFGERHAYRALSGADLVAARSLANLKEALDAGAGSDSLAFDEFLRSSLQRLGPPVLARVAGDAQRILQRDPARARQLRAIRWIAALGSFEGSLEAAGDRVNISFDLSSRRVPLAERDLPLPPGTSSPRIHDAGAPASVAVLEPERLARFLERSTAVTDPEGYERYRTAVGQLRDIFGVDLHKDLLRPMTSVSLAFRSAAAATAVAPLAPGSARDVERALARTQPALDFAIGDFVPGASIVPSGPGSARSWELRNGRLELARYAVRDGALVAAAGLADLPATSAGTRVRGVHGSLVFQGRARRVGPLAEILLPGFEDLVSVIGGFGEVSFGVLTDTRGLSITGRAQVGRARR